MSLPLTFALGVVMATAADNYEWKGIFYTPDDEYKWLAQMTGSGAGPKGYVDPAMTIALVPATNVTGSELEIRTPTGNDLLAGTCEDVNDGGTLTPSASKCYNLKFDQTKSESSFVVDASSDSYIAFFCQHVPTEFEDTAHYFKDTTGADIEPGAQAPEPDGDGHGHSHGGGDGDADAFSGFCVCQAESNGWKIDCSNMEPVKTSVAALKADSHCKMGDPPQSCVDNYFVMQAHHDHCLHDVLPTGIEQDLHDYEHFYQDCFIKRQFDEALPACAEVECGSAAVTQAISKLNSDCTTTTACASSACGDAMKTVLMAHDVCPEDTLDDNLEKTLHDHEEACEAQLCNSASEAFDPYDQSCSNVVDAARSQQSVLVMTLALCFAVCLVSF